MRKPIVVLFLLFCLSAAVACAQSVSGGAIVGAPVLNVTSSQSIGGVQYTPQSLHVTVGGSFQLDFPWRLRLEVDALYRPASYSLGTLPNNATASDWKFPTMMEYKFKTPLASGRMQPFAGAGVSFDHLYQVSHAPVAGTGSVVTNSPAGMLFVGGVDFKLLGKRASAELRYTRQVHDSVVNLSQLNQADFLLGIHF